MNRLEAWQMADEAQLLQHCVPVFFLAAENALPGSITNNGTLALIASGQRAFLVTCCHVWDEFIEYRFQVPTARLATVFANGFGQPIFLSDDLLIDCDRDLDLAVFGTSLDDWDIGNKQFYSPDRWPIPLAKQGSVLAFVGFAGNGRHVCDLVGDFRYSFFGLSVSSVSDRKFVIASGQSPRHLLDNNGQPIPRIRLGGISGSPAYVRSASGCFALAGLVQMGATSNANIFLTHATCLKSDGTLDR